jgi:nicotinate-nucleotide pyrophosphorylase (carboxylating)
MIERELIQKAIRENVRQALEEDIGTGDITAQLIPVEQQSIAHVITRDNCVLAGQEWADEVFKTIDASLAITWHASEGAQLNAGDKLFSVSGNARSILSAERCALNFIQTLSATASVSAHYASLVAHTKVRILDTRKTLPGLRIAQKYAVSVSAAQNHRIGLYDAFLIKENHIMACGSITNAVSKAQDIAPGRPVEIEVESLIELDEALTAGADIIMLDNFSLEQMREAVTRSTGRAKLEASGNVTSETLVPIAETGVDFISIGALTKDVKAIDLSMRFEA